MRTKLQRRGKGLAVQVQKQFAAEADLDSKRDSGVNVFAGASVIPPRPTLVLGELLAQVTDDSLHGEIGPDSVVGHEVW